MPRTAGVSCSSLTLFSLQTQATHGRAVGFLAADRAAHQLNLDGFLFSCHDKTPNQAVKISSTDLPRLDATSDGVVLLRSASNVARTML